MRRVAWVVVILGFLILLSDLMCGLLIATLGNRPMPPRGDPSGPQQRFKVAVLGDAQKGLRNLSNLVRWAKAENVDFILQTGDLVSNNDEGHYRLTALYLQREAITVPFVVVPGNHDLKGGPDRFRREHGELEFSFRRGKTAFVILNDADSRPPDPAYVERRIAAVAQPDDTVVLAMHVPPFEKDGQPRAGWEAFNRWLEGSRVHWLFCGHIHGYVMKEIGKTIVIANGVGGDSDSWEFDQPVQATMLYVDGPTTANGGITLASEHGFRENLEHLALGHVWEAYRRHPIPVWGATLLILGGVGWGWRVILRKPKIPPAP